MKKIKENNTIEINKVWEFDEVQSITVFDKKYNIHAAIMQARDIEVKNLVIADMSMSYTSPCHDNLRSFIQHIKHVNDADLDYPIIMNEDGYIIDGRHRLAKAILEGKETIKTKRFKSDPPACFDWV